MTKVVYKTLVLRAARNGFQIEACHAGHRATYDVFVAKSAEEAMEIMTGLAAKITAPVTG